MAAYLEQDFSWEMCSISIEYGVDSYSTPQVCAFALELLEAGILTEDDFPGMPSDTRGRFFWLVEKIARREGIGDILANGVSLAARHIGKGAEAYDHNTVKNFEQVPIKLVKLNPVYFLMTATGEKMTITQIEGSFPQNPLPTIEQRQNFVDKWYAVPNEKFKEYFLSWEKKDRISIEAACEVAGWNEIMHYIDDISGLCGFLSSFRGQFGQRPDLPTENKPVYHIHSIPPLISLVTGMDIGEDRLWRMARRTRTLVRAINARRGLRREDDKVPPTHWMLRDPELEEKLMDGYYKYQGWNNDGIPTKETLEELELGYVSEDLIRRGILTDSEGAPAKETPVTVGKK